MHETDLFSYGNEQKLMSGFVWWEKKRLLYNILTGLAGLIIVLSFGIYSFGLFDLFGILLWGFVANVFYCIGFVIEPILKYYLKRDIDFSEKRPVLFWIGTVFSIIVTISYGFLYYIIGVAQP